MPKIGAILRLRTKPSGDQKKLFSVTKNRSPPLLMTQPHSLTALASFFAQKIVTIQDKLHHMASTLPPESIVVPPTASTVVPSMECFSLLSQLDVHKLIQAAPKKSCMLDPMPTPLIVGY